MKPHFFEARDLLRVVNHVEWPDGDEEQEEDYIRAWKTLGAHVFGGPGSIFEWWNRVPAPIQAVLAPEVGAAFTGIKEVLSWIVIGLDNITDSFGLRPTGKELTPSQSVLTGMKGLTTIQRAPVETTSFSSDEQKIYSVLEPIMFSLYISLKGRYGTNGEGTD